MSIFENKAVFVTGAGSLGTELVRQLLQKDVHSIRVFDNSEQALFRLETQFPDEKRLRYILGDVADLETVGFACKNVDYVCHTAAKKFIQIGENNPAIFIQTNVHGTENVIKSCLAHDVGKAIFISSDKALHEFGIYAKTKAIGEDLWHWAYRISSTTKFSIIRSGNFMPSAGAIFDIWNSARATDKKILVTDKRMKRYFIKIEDIAAFVLSVLETMQGGETFVPKCEEKEIYKLALEYAQGDESRIKIIGLRPGEQLSERLLSEEEEAIAVDMGSYWIIYPR